MSSKDLIAVYHGIEYRISSNDRNEFIAVVQFPDGEDTALYNSEERAVAASENIIDDFRMDCAMGGRDED